MVPEHCRVDSWRWYCPMCDLFPQSGICRTCPSTRLCRYRVSMSSIPSDSFTPRPSAPPATQTSTSDPLHRVSPVATPTWCPTPLPLHRCSKWPRPRTRCPRAAGTGLRTTTTGGDPRIPRGVGRSWTRRQASQMCPWSIKTSRAGYGGAGALCAVGIQIARRFARRLFQLVWTRQCSQPAMTGYVRL